MLSKIEQSSGWANKVGQRVKVDFRHYSASRTLTGAQSEAQKVSCGVIGSESLPKVRFQRAAGGQQVKNERVCKVRLSGPTISL